MKVLDGSNGRGAGKNKQDNFINWLLKPNHLVLTSWLLGMATMLLFTLLRGVIGVQASIIPESIIVINRETIAFSIGMLVSFLISQVTALTRKDPEILLDMTCYCMVYFFVMVFYTYDAIAWFRIMLGVVTLIGIEYITLTFLKKKTLARINNQGERNG